MSGALTAADAAALRECIAAGGVAVFPADTVYGLCCDPESERAVARLYELKGRPRERAAAVMFFTLDAAFAVLGEVEREQLDAAARLLPGPFTVLLDNPRERYAAACGGDPRTLGLRVPALPPAIAALEAVGGPLLQSSANLSGGADARRVSEIPQSIRDGAGMVLDGGTLPGVPSTVVDLRAAAAADAGPGAARHRVLREGAVSADEVARLLAGAA